MKLIEWKQHVKEMQERSPDLRILLIPPIEVKLEILEKQRAESPNKTEDPDFLNKWIAIVKEEMAQQRPIYEQPLKVEI